MILTTNESWNTIVRYIQSTQLRLWYSLSWSQRTFCTYKRKYFSSISYDTIFTHKWRPISWKKMGSFDTENFSSQKYCRHTAEYDCLKAPVQFFCCWTQSITSTQNILRLKHKELLSMILWFKSWKYFIRDASQNLFGRCMQSTQIMLWCSSSWL